MKASKDIRSVSYLKAKTSQVLSQVHESRRPVYITQKGEARVVIQDADSYERMRDALSLMRIIAMSEENIREGRVISHKDVMRKAEEIIKTARSKHAPKTA